MVLKVPQPVFYDLFLLLGPYLDLHNVVMSNTGIKTLTMTLAFLSLLRLVVGCMSHELFEEMVRLLSGGNWYHSVKVKADNLIITVTIIVSDTAGLLLGNTTAN